MVHARWRIESHIRTRRLGRMALAHHIGSGETHLLDAASGNILDHLAGHADNSGCSLAELAGEGADGLSEEEIGDILVVLADAGIVRREYRQ